jgi:hypothetical protein
MTSVAFNIADQRFMIPKILISISTTNPTYILHTMPEDIQECMCALIGSALVSLVALRQQQETQQNDEQTDFLENPVPHINAATKFN